MRERSVNEVADYFKRLVSETDGSSLYNVLNSLSKCNPLGLSQTCWSSGNVIGSIIENKLKTIDLHSMKIEKRRIAVINCIKNKRSINET